MLFRPTNTCLQPPDADGAGGLGALLPAEAQEQHSHDGIGFGRPGRDRSHRCSGYIAAGPPLQLRGPHKVCLLRSMLLSSEFTVWFIPQADDCAPDVPL